MLKKHIYYPKKLLVYLKFKCNWCPVFYPLTLPYTQLRLFSLFFILPIPYLPQRLTELTESLPLRV